MPVAQTIHKTVLDLTERQQIMVPILAEMLSVQRQGDSLCLWYRCDPNAQKEARSIAIVGTGQPAPLLHEAEHIGTVQDGAFVWHVFIRL